MLFQQQIEFTLMGYGTSTVNTVLINNQIGLSMIDYIILVQIKKIKQLSYHRATYNVQ